MERKVDVADQKDRIKTNQDAENEHMVERLNLVVKETNNHFEQGIIGEDYTIISIKDESTYMMAAIFRGLKVIKNGIQIYSAKLPEEEEETISQAVYAAHLDCFFLTLSNKIYRKDLDDLPPYLYISSGLNFEEVLDLKYSPFNKILILLGFPTQLTVANLEDKTVEQLPLEELKGELTDFKVFGEEENRLLTMSDSGYISLVSFNFQLKRLIALNQPKVDLNQEINEGLSSIAVSELNDHVLVELEGKSGCSRIMIFEVQYNTFMKKHEYCPNLKQKNNFCLECFGRVQNHILWVGLEHGKLREFKVYDYDVKTKKLKHLVDKGVNTQTDNVNNIIRVGNGFFYASDGGKIFQLSLNF